MLLKRRTGHPRGNPDAGSVPGRNGSCHRTLPNQCPPCGGFAEAR